MYSRDENYVLTGDLRISSIDGVVRHLGVDTAIIETPYSEDAYARTGPGCGFVVYRDGLRRYSGLVASERAWGWDSEQGVATIKVQTLGDNVHVGKRLAFPDPSRAGDAQTTYDYWTPRDGSGNPVQVAGTTALWRLINEHLGPGATADRRVPTLTMGVDPAAGAVRTYQFLFDNVLTAAQQISAVCGADPGIRIDAAGGALVADIYLPRDLTGDVRFSADMTNLAGFGYTETAPAATYVLAAGQGDLHLRARKASATTDPLDLRWGVRSEVYLDQRDESDLAKLQQASDDELAQSKGQIALTTTLTDTQATRLGVDYDLGDKVTVYVGLPGGPKSTVADVIREVAFTVDNTGAETFKPAIGTPDASALKTTASQKQLARIRRALSGLIVRNP